MLYEVITIFTEVNSVFKIFSGSKKFILSLNKLFIQKDFSPKVYHERDVITSYSIHYTKLYDKIREVFD